MISFQNEQDYQINVAKERRNPYSHWRIWEIFYSSEEKSGNFTKNTGNEMITVIN